jgi:hypothetical protein
VVGIFSTRASLIRLVGMVLTEQDDEWLTHGKRYLPQHSMTRLMGGIPGTSLAELLREGVAV